MKQGKLTKILLFSTAVFLSIGMALGFYKPVLAASAGVSATEFVSMFEKTAGSDWGTNTCKTEYAELPSDMLFTGAGLQVSVGKQTVTGRLYNTSGVENISQNGITFKNGVNLGDNVWNGGNGISGTNASTFTYTPAITLAFPGTAGDRSGVLDNSKGWRSQFNDFIVRFEDSTDSSKWIDVLISSWNWGRSCGYATRFSNGVSERDSQFFATNADSRDGKLRSFLCCNENGKRGAVMNVQSPNMSGMNSLSEAPISLCYVENDGIYAVSGNYWVLIRAFNQGTNAENLISVPFNGFSDSSNVKISVFGKSVNVGTYGNSITGDCAVYTIMGIDGVEFTKNADGTVNVGEATYSIEIDGDSVYLDGEKLTLSVKQKTFISESTVSSGSITVKFNGTNVKEFTDLSKIIEYTLNQGFGTYEFIWSNGTDSVSKKIITDLSALFEKTQGSDWKTNSCDMHYEELPSVMKYSGAGLQVSVGGQEKTGRLLNSTSIAYIPENGITFKQTIDLSDNGNVWNGGNAVSGTGAKSFDYTPFITLAFPGTTEDRANGAYGSGGSIRQQFTDMVVRLEDATDSSKRIDIALGFWKWSSSMGLGASFSNSSSEMDEKFFGTNPDSRDGQLRIRQVADENTPYDRGVPLKAMANIASDAPISLCYVEGDGIYAVSGDNWTLVRGFEQALYSTERPKPFNGFTDSSKVKLSVFGYAVNRDTDDSKIQGESAVYTIMNIDGVEFTKNTDGTVNTSKYLLEVSGNEILREGNTVNLSVKSKSLLGDSAACTLGSIEVKRNGTTVETISNLSEANSYLLTGYGEYEFVWKDGKVTSSKKVTVVSRFYTLTYDYNYSGIDNDTVQFDNTTIGNLTLSAPVDAKIPDGKFFIGWFTAATDGVQITSLTEVKDTTVYAHWEDGIVISFVSDGKVINQQTIRAGETPSAVADPTLKGHTFKGWYIGEEEYKFTSLDSDTEIVAKFEINTYTISFYADGLLLGNTYTAGFGTKLLDAVTTLPEIPAKDGYNNTAPYFEYNGTKIDENTLVDGDMTIEAKYIPNEYTVRVVDGNREILNTKVTFGEKFDVDQAILLKEHCVVISVSYNGNMLNLVDGKYTLSNVTGDTVIEVIYGLESFNYGGAWIRLKTANDDTGNGIRFKVSIAKAKYDEIIAIDANANFGTLIIPQNLAGNGLTIDNELARNAVANGKMNTETVDGVEYYFWMVYLWNIPENNYSRDVIVRGYISFGNNVVYTEVSEPRSLSVIAQLCTKDENVEQSVKDAVAGYLPKVKYDLNGATGTVNDYVLMDGVEYVLPEIATLNVEIPSGKTFKGFEIAGKKHFAGEKIVVNGTVTIKMIWEAA